ncbi:glycosyltransferase [Streptomyces sp. NBC_01275]|uniref:glycosyltransferase n=1 Tax=Streptomyces sp. NBC_01275 TaxID=2903807 RepID=UPI002257F615|nr:glycosyltransferase [Streptomyces sp. NBC_01275]MCX4764231.1 glycosyltransferase [Streptomyces sp. NBC_01275]
MRPPTTPRGRPATTPPQPIPGTTVTQESHGSAGGDAVTDLSDLPPARPWRSSGLWSAAALLAALALWGYAVTHTDVSDLGDFGLVTALHPAFWAGLALLTAGFWFTLRGPHRHPAWAPAFVVGLLVMERATQAVVYPTPLYAWAWKHDAVIDHLLTAGHLQTADALGDMAVYDQWPGFFAAQATLVKLLGVDSAAQFMAWWPLVSSLMLLLPLLLIYRTFTEDRRLIWTAVWLFYVADWVGQDYFSPQSVAFALHLGVLAVVLRRYASGGTAGGRTVGTTGGTARQTVWTVLLTLLVVAIVISHQLTPAMLVVSLAALFFARRYRDRVPLITTAVIFLAWCLTAALPFLSATMPDMLRSVGDVGGNVATGYGATPTGTGAVTTSWAARLLSGSVLLLAAFGALRRPVLRHRALPLLLLALAPLPMFAASSYGAEMIFRVLMFMLPGAAFFAAAALLPQVRTQAAVEAQGVRPEPRRFVWLPLLALLAGTFAFVPSYSGKDRISYFPPAEVDLVQQVFDQAPDGSLVVAADRNYPLAFADYWRVDHYWFLDDARHHVDLIVRDPAATLARDMASVESPARSYLLFTQGQLADSEMNGLLTEAQLTRIEKSVAASPLFERVAHNSAGSAYALKAPATTTSKAPKALKEAGR